MMACSVQAKLAADAVCMTCAHACKYCCCSSSCNGLSQAGAAQCYMACHLERLRVCSKVDGIATPSSCLPADGTIASHERHWGGGLHRKPDSTAVAGTLQQHDAWHKCRFRCVLSGTISGCDLCSRGFSSCRQERFFLSPLWLF